MIRKLLTVIAIICAIIISAGCSDTKKEESRPAKESSEKENSVKETPLAEEKPQRLTDTEVCDLACGYYVNKAYFNDFERTKSTIDSQELGEILVVRKNEDEKSYSIMHGDMHQGNMDRALTEVEYMEESNEYFLYFEPYFESNETLLIYNADTQTFVYRGYGRMKLTSGEFLKFDTYEGHREYMAYLLLKNSPDVTVEGQKVYATLNGNRKLIEIHSDAMFDSAEAQEMLAQGALGYAILSENETDPDIFHFYFIEDDCMIIKDANSNILLTLNL